MDLASTLYDPPLLASAFPDPTDHFLCDLPLGLSMSTEAYPCGMETSRKRKRLDDPQPPGNKRPALKVHAEWSAGELREMGDALCRLCDRDMDIHAQPLPLSCHSTKSEAEVSALLHFVGVQVHRLLQLIGAHPHVSVAAAHAFVLVEAARLSGSVALGDHSHAQPGASSRALVLVLDTDGNECGPSMRDVDFASHMRNTMVSYGRNPPTHSNALAMSGAGEAPARAAPSTRPKRTAQKIKVGLYPVNADVCEYLQDAGLKPLQSIVTPPKKTLAKVIAYVTSKWEKVLAPRGLSVVLLPHHPSDTRQWTSAHTNVTTRQLYDEFRQDTVRLLFGFDKMSLERDYEFLESLEEIVHEDEQRAAQRAQSGCELSGSPAMSCASTSPYEGQGGAGAGTPVSGPPSSSPLAASPAQAYGGGGGRGELPYPEAEHGQGHGPSAVPFFANPYFAEAASGEAARGDALATSTPEVRHHPHAHSDASAASTASSGAAQPQGSAGHIHWEVSSDGFRGHDSRLQEQADEVYYQTDSLCSDNWASCNILMTSGSQLTASAEMSRGASLSASAPLRSAPASSPGISPAFLDFFQTM
eukprot:TRINITY_DN8060_c0_g1_i1.p1 TRINITY_DN8060_c0_g1~~TRINITY_DN8060_c0_g1_i1.p1  ORF type:complete len:586 (+),score=134.37 TRINITY_DN8060_c0_g1_i1:126-1883(+)